jgi:peptidoglycan/LPS O-acetylase OafA/YrhL
MQSLLFRKDIQGLRGIAIFFVLIFHFYPDIFPKGFLGVDLFFVISSFLFRRLDLKPSLVFSGVTKGKEFITGVV